MPSIREASSIGIPKYRGMLFSASVSASSNRELVGLIGMC